MGMAIEGENGHHTECSHTSWGALLGAAMEHGWHPQGTDAPGFVCLKGDGTPDFERTFAYAEAKDDWSGTYFTNDGQVVTEEDAANLADALESALCRSSEATERLWALEPLAREIIDLCRAGAFVIN